MPVADYPHGFLRGLSEFWTRFFADAPQLDAIYKGSAVLMGQAYLDLLSTVLGVSLRDAVALDREHYRMIAIREDEISFVEGLDPEQDRWVYRLPDPLVDFAMLDNRVVEPTASLEPGLDYEVVRRVIGFHVDPTDPSGNGEPLPGFARRALDVATGGSLVDASVVSWSAEGVRKGDVVRLLDVGQDGTQRRRSDHVVVLVRSGALQLAAETPLPPVRMTDVPYVVLRVPAEPLVLAESLVLVGGRATVARTRLDQGSVRVFAKAPDGGDVVEGVDYEVNHEHGRIRALTSWIGLIAGTGTFAISYTWRREVSPSLGTSPRLASSGVASGVTRVARSLQVAFWAPDARVDRRTLANNFGVLIGRVQDSSEAYRAFLSGVFQLYVLGPVLERIESALNVILGFPVVRDDGETFEGLDLSDPVVDRVLVTRPASGLAAAYDFPKGTPFRADLAPGKVLQSFEPLTTAVVVTDYVQTPTWWHGSVIPEALFSPVGGEPPSVFRRTASPAYVSHVAGASDDPRVGDPGLLVGADETGFVPPPGQPALLRHRVAFVLMDRWLKHHTFSVRFDALAVSIASGEAFARGVQDLNELVLSARPSHTFVFTTPSSAFRDQIQIGERDISFARQVGSRVFGPDRIVVADDAILAGDGAWNAGDHFHYELYDASVAFPTLAPVTLGAAPPAPRRRRLVRVHLSGLAGGRALVEGLDYQVDLAACAIARLTTWDVLSAVVTWRQLNILNAADGAIPAGDMPLLVNGVNPALAAPSYDPAAAGWDGVSTPPNAPRDMGLVERALVLHVH